MFEQGETVVIEEEEEFSELGQLKTKAPEASFERLHKRVQLAQLGKDLVEKQAFAFWTVIDAFLRVIFAPRKKSESESETGEK